MTGEKACASAGDLLVERSLPQTLRNSCRSARVLGLGWYQLETFYLSRVCSPNAICSCTPSEEHDVFKVQDACTLGSGGRAIANGEVAASARCSFYGFTL